MALATYMSRK